MLFARVAAGFVASRLAASDDPRFTNELWTAIEALYQKTLAHPFLKGLADGTLPRARFEFYLKQDALYLGAFAQVLNVIASKSPREDWARTLAQHAIDSIKEKESLHETILKGVALKDGGARMAPTNYAYTNHLLATAQRGTFAEGLAAVLPCYWIYQEVGKDLKKRGSKNAAYKRWIDNYSDPAYGASVQAVLRMMNSEATHLSTREKARCKDLFVTSARYEFMFWEMAWRLEEWLP
ncbi:MAG: thiaminase II [Bryobacteraceae bacterium]